MRVLFESKIHDVARKIEYEFTNKKSFVMKQFLQLITKMEKK